MIINSAVQSPCELETVVLPILESVGIEVCGEIGLDKGFLEPQGELGSWRSQIPALISVMLFPPWIEKYIGNEK